MSGPMASREAGRPEGSLRRGRFAVGLFGVLVLAAAAVAAWFHLHREQPIPGGDLSGAEPRVARAIEDARSAVRAAPRSAEAWGRLGMVLMTHEYPRPARECFRRAEALDARAVHWIYLRAFTHLDDPPRAVDLLERALALREADPTCRLLLADTLLRLGRAEDAEGHYRRVADHPDSAARARLGLARVALARGYLAKARAHAEQAARLAPKGRGLAELLAEVYLRLGDTSAAQREQDRLAGLADQPWPDPYLEESMRYNVGQGPRLELAQRRLDQGRPTEALAILDEVVGDYPESVPAWLSLCRAHLRLRQWSEAQPPAERALELAPDDSSAWADLGTALAQQGRLDRAESCYRRSLRLNPQDGDTHYQLAFCRLQRGDRAAAERSFRDSVRVRPQYAAGWRELGRLLAGVGREAEAQTSLRRAVELAPADTGARALLREVEQRLRRGP